MFKKGDIVKCISAVTGQLTLNKLYTILEVKKGVDSGYVIVRSDKNSNRSSYASRFELVRSRRNLPDWF